jgi:membrane-associated protease RseP (regulator of RpoE activity)
MNALSITLAAVLFLGTVIAHEAGHFVSMRRAGIRIHSAGIGFPFPPTFTVYRKKRPDGGVMKFQLSPWVLGAFVRAEDEDEKRIDTLPYRQFAWIMGSGVVINVVLGLVLLSLGAMLSGNWNGFVAYNLIAVVLWLGRKLFTAYVVPVIGLPVLGLSIWGFITAVQDRAQVGIVGMGKMFTWATDIRMALLLAGALSLLLGLANMVPLFPFDGGRIFSRVLMNLGASRRAATLFEVTTSTLAIGSIMFSLMTDILFA